MKKWIGILMLVVVGILAVGCSDSGNELKADTKTETTNKTLRFGTLPAESAIPIILAKEKGFFKEEKVNVEITPFNAPNDRNVAAQAGKIDGMIGDVMTALSMREGGMDFTITSDINEDFKLLSAPNSGIMDIKQLDGKEVSLVPKFLLEYIMDEMAAKNDISYKIVQIPSISARYEALLNNQVDSVIFTEPQATLLQKNGAHVLGSSAKYNIKGGTISFASDVVKSQKADIAAFYRAYNKGVSYMNEHDAADYADVLKAYKFPEAMTGYLENKEEKYTKAQKVSKKQFDSIEKWTKEKEMIQKDYSYDEMTNFSMLD